ncbi:adenosylcobinamide-phosphate synthase CbiB [Myxosarcina sp. GI1(2024)]
MTIAIDIQPSASILLLAAITDFFIGDPWNWLHPVRVMGGIIKISSQWIIASTFKPWQRRWGGILLGTSMIIGSGLAGWGIIELGNRIHPWLGKIIAVVLLASCFAGKSLRLAIEDVLQPLTQGNLATARSRLSLYVGRDTENLSESEILRALLETVAENAVDGVTAPLFYAILGAFIPAVGSVPLALGYKAASTLDSMIGYRREPYRHLGWFSARLEDYLTWIPCRLTVLTLSLGSGSLLKVLALCWRDAASDPSPNSGWSECVYAAILKVQLGGTNFYRGVAKIKPLLGNSIESITTQKIIQALRLTRYCFLSWLAFSILLSI